MTLEEFEAQPIEVRLRAPAYWMSGSGFGHEGQNDLPFKAAAEIEQLRVRLGIATVALKKIRRAARMVNRKLADKKVEKAIAMITGAVKRWERAAGKK